MARASVADPATICDDTLRRLLDETRAAAENASGASIRRFRERFGTERAVSAVRAMVVEESSTAHAGHSIRQVKIEPGESRTTLKASI